jgi:hypothetical protein
VKQLTLLNKLVRPIALQMKKPKASLLLSTYLPN